MKQHTADFEARYSAGDTPWEDPEPWRGLASLFARFAPPGGRVLDAGCGFGTNALRLAALGYEVTAVDVSPTAIATAVERRDAAGLDCRLLVADFLSDDCGRHDVVFDRGCLHGFTDAAGRAAFVAAVAAALPPGGLWLEVCGSAENGDPPDSVREHGLPRLSLVELVGTAETFFEAVEIAQGAYGSTPATSFRAWIGVFRRRP